MPSTYAHYRMGQEVLKQLSCPVREIIMENKESTISVFTDPIFCFIIIP